MFGIPKREKPAAPQTPRFDGIVEAGKEIERIMRTDFADTSLANGSPEAVANIKNKLSELEQNVIAYVTSDEAKNNPGDLKKAQDGLATLKAFVAKDLAA